MLKNENGSSLIIVLLIMTVFTIVGIGLIGLNVNNAKQISKTGNDLQATNLAEMATTHLKNEVQQILEIHNDKSLTDVKMILQNDLQANVINKPFQIKNELKNPSYQIEKANVSSSDDGTAEKIWIDFISLGTSQSLQTKQIEGKIQISRAKKPVYPTKPAHATEVPTAINYDHNNDGTFDQTMYYEQGFTMKSNTSLTFDSDLYAKGMIKLESNTDLWVKGDAYVELLDLKTNDNNHNDHGNLALMCVDKTLFVYSTTQVSVETNFTDCESVLDKKPKNGIFAKQVIYESPDHSSTWQGANQSMMDTKYK